ncbi:11-beta-hydroxysteroid dehydrogenase 1B-like [Olea europaea var. sylvestris]|uniref:11-beta-hydroxysteroid dehydrogenase 1B-like n=1 Tax=Olea europaea subsp. europaea TaxID=158383 RepID=A0A8S0RCH3_OLEEU|nr:11-beta-hydroxysteroid dehydrogenase 1B-like [Olea europaea var. sylvestris]CAA2976378.1 11-beta-hydroxysteroid dehydrogenase 1B-like [Olea europaea subsp. europaea]
MELIHTFLNLVTPPFTFFTLLLLLPPFQILKFFLSILGSVFTEDVAGKVVIITGASSGIGEHLAYEYAKRGARLVLAARRERSLQEVAERARDIGAPDVVVVRADVSKVEDCRRIVDQTMNHFGRLDHLVNNAGVMSVSTLEEAEDVTDFKAIMDINFWGYAYMTKFAAPYLRNSQGRIVVLSSSASWLPGPRMSFYNASKAAVAQFFETLRIEFGPDIGITLVMPGFIESELTQGKFVSKAGKVEVDQDMRDVQVNINPIQRVESCAKAIVNSACRGERYLTVPAWFRVSFFWKTFCPEVLEWLYRLLYITSPGNSSKEAFGKKLVDLTGAKAVLYPETVQTPETKKD